MWDEEHFEYQEQLSDILALSSHKAEAELGEVVFRVAEEGEEL